MNSSKSKLFFLISALTIFLIAALIIFADLLVNGPTHTRLSGLILSLIMISISCIGLRALRKKSQSKK